MAPRISGFTRASSLGPIAEFMGRQGCSVSRVLKEIDLPLALLEQPDLIIPLREQFRFLERAARRTGDPYFGARLGQVVRAPKLSAYGAWVCSADTLLDAIKRAQAGLHTMLQTSTFTKLGRHGKTARWSIEFVEPETEGRHHNEFLGISYQIDTIRAYAGRNWCPEVVLTSLPEGAPRAQLEEIFRTNVSHGHSATTIVFDAALLNSQRLTNAKTGHKTPGSGSNLPDDILSSVASVVELALYDGYPRIDWVAAKLEVPRRSFQRLLEAHGSNFNHIVAEVIFSRAKMLLAADTTPITEIALQLGYRDAAHFTRAFKRWAGVSPICFRNLQ
ncbi:MAG: AraC family transcriptional regulator ligand-binding domain-containing protein [Pseudomonadota bacterium]